MSRHIPEKSTQQRAHPFHSLMRSFWGDDLNLFDDRVLGLGERRGNLSLSEDDSHIYVEADLAGLSENEIDITLDKGVLWIKGEKEEKQDDKKYHQRAYRSYSYKIALPDSANQDATPVAKYEKGVLSITFDKVKGETAKKIKVKSQG